VERSTFIFNHFFATERAVAAGNDNLLAVRQPLRTMRTSHARLPLNPAVHPKDANDRSNLYQGYRQLRENINGETVESSGEKRFQAFLELVIRNKKGKGNGGWTENGDPGSFLENTRCTIEFGDAHGAQ